MVLRISVAVSLLADGTAHWTLVTSLWLLLAFLLPALLLVIGFLTPYAAGVACLLQCWAAIFGRGEHQLDLLASILNTGVVALIGPGAYSVDAHIFGRRLLTASPRR